MNTEGLRRLARYYGIQTEYRDVKQQRCEAAPEALLRALRILGAPLERMDEVRDATRHRRQECWRTLLEPVVVAWDDRPCRVRLRVPARSEAARAVFRIELEGGHLQEYPQSLAELPTVRRRRVEGEDYCVKDWAIPESVPWGYHRLHVDLAGHHAESLLIAAPRMVYAKPPSGQERFWGVFVPLYALHRDASWGAGDFSDLEVFMEWVAQRGGSLAATLPLLSTLWELGGDPSPYAPASRLFWNEFYLDATRTAEYARCPEARAILQQTDLPEDRALSGRPQLVDYAGQMQVKRQVLEMLAGRFHQEPETRQNQLEQYRRENALADDFARFRAVGERQGQFWSKWPQRLRDGRIQPGDYDENIYRYHLYTQWQIEEQLRGMIDTAQASQLLWYLDFPLGVSGDGYDVWRHRDVFALGASGGAPPDTFFTKGQNWGFPPLNPHKLRQEGYRYLIAALDRHLSHASVLRIDHIMMLHRLYWVPDGLEASDGVYVRYPREELFALLTLESHQHQAWILGENLGTVPDILNEAMAEHGVGEMFVVQYELKPDEKQPMRSIPSRCVAAVNTHDMPPFAAFWAGLDIDDRLDLGLLNEREAGCSRDEQAELRRALVAFLRAHGLVSPDSRNPADVLEACLAMLAASPAAMVLVNLEDLWQETLPQNTPGTSTERPNWRRKTRYSFEAFRKLPDVLRILETVDKYRKKPADDLVSSEEQDG